jgi:class I fructose-bisphosphate aldolase
MMSCIARMNRLFDSDGRCFEVAMDHGFFNVPEFVRGIENIDESVRTVIQGKPDAMLLSLGQARFLQDLGDKRKPALVLRADVSNAYQPKIPASVFDTMIDRPIETALRLDAVGVVLNLFFDPEGNDINRQCIDNILRIKPECERYGMCLMIEPLVLKRSAPTRGGYTLNSDIDLVVPLVRQSVELGADIVKADPTDSLENYHRVVQASGGKPVLPRGGGRVTPDQILERTVRLIAAGCRGVVYGRNIFQHKDPVAMIRAIHAIVHGSADLAEARSILLGKRT